MLLFFSCEKFRTAISSPFNKLHPHLQFTPQIHLHLNYISQTYFLAARSKLRGPYKRTLGTYCGGAAVHEVPQYTREKKIILLMRLVYYGHSSYKGLYCSALMPTAAPPHCTSHNARATMHEPQWTSCNTPLYPFP